MRESGDITVCKHETCQAKVSLWKVYKQNVLGSSDINKFLPKTLGRKPCQQTSPRCLCVCTERVKRKPQSPPDSLCYSLQSFIIMLYGAGSSSTLSFWESVRVKQTWWRSTPVQVTRAQLMGFELAIKCQKNTICWLLGEPVNCTGRKTGSF